MTSGEVQTTNGPNRPCRACSYRWPIFSQYPDKVVSALDVRTILRSTLAAR